MRTLNFLRPVMVAGIAAAMLAAGASGARADRIDGSWCNAEGDNPRIDGPKIVTLNMLQHFDELMSIRLPDGTAQPWRRCEVIS